MTTQATPESPATSAPALPDQAALLLPQLAGYAGTRTVAIGLRHGIITALGDRPGGLTADEVATEVGLDTFYTAVWLRAARAAGVCEDVADESVAGDATGAGRVRLAPHMDTLLLDTSSPAYLGAMFTTIEKHEIFGRFDEHLADGERLWWDECSPEFIEGVSGTGTPFYTRLVPGGLALVPGLADTLARPCRVLETACGAGVGVVRLAETYPAVTVVGADGDAHSLALARRRIEEKGLGDRVELIRSPLEDLSLDGGFALVTNNISMHECRDRDRVTANVSRALDPGGWFVISDFPFPETAEGLRSAPGRIMSGIQFFEAQIDDQLQPRSTYDALLARHGFVEIDHADITPVHAVTFGRK